jgi:hypothetical protein
MNIPFMQRKFSFIPQISLENLVHTLYDNAEKVSKEVFKLYTYSAIVFINEVEKRKNELNSEVIEDMVYFHNLLGAPREICDIVKAYLFEEISEKEAEKKLNLLL